MKVFIANFGQENYEWPVCLERGTVATMNDVDAQPLWEQGKREEYILSRMQGKTAAGLSPTRPVAARWYNLMTIISETSGDVWIHRDGERLYWTTSTDAPPTFEHKVEPVGRKREVVVCHKRCRPWSDRTRNGNHLLWRSLHPKARDFLSTEATLQELSKDNAQYALALINGDDLKSWHDRQLWRDKNQKASSQYSEVKSYSRRQMVAYRVAEERMADMALKTTLQSNGQEATNKTKIKEFRFSSKTELERHIVALLELQEGLCALTDLPLEMDEKNGDKEFFSSLDRIDSDGHYEAGNLQVVCRFANRWKGADDNAEFRRLIEHVRSYRSIDAS